MIPTWGFCGVLVVTEDCPVASSRHRADDNVGVPEGRPRRELVPHEGDVFNVAYKHK